MAFLGPNPKTFVTNPSLGPDAFVSGLNMTVTGPSTFIISPGACRDLISDYVITFDSVSTGLQFLEVDLTRLGPNGCFPIPMSAFAPVYSTTLCVYIVANTSGTTGGSTSPLVNPAIIVATGDEFLPKQYNAYRRIGYIFINGSTGENPEGPVGTISPWSQSGTGNERTYQLQTSRIRFSDAGATTYSPIYFTQTTGFQGGCVPAKPNVPVTFFIRLNVASIGDGIVFSQDGISSAHSPAPFVLIMNNQGGAGNQAIENFSMVAGLSADGRNSQIFYSCFNVGTTFQLNNTGFIDSIGATVF